MDVQVVPTPSRRNISNDENIWLGSTLLLAYNLPEASNFILTHPGEEDHIILFIPVEVELYTELKKGDIAHG